MNYQSIPARVQISLIYLMFQVLCHHWLLESFCEAIYHANPQVTRLYCSTWDLVCFFTAVKSKSVKSNSFLYSLVHLLLFHSTVFQACHLLKDQPSKRAHFISFLCILLFNWDVSLFGGWLQCFWVIVYLRFP